METYKLEDYLHEYVVKTYNLSDFGEYTTNGFGIDVRYISRGLVYAYNYNKDEIAIQQIPGLTQKIKSEFVSKFGLKFIHTLRESRNYDYPGLYPYYSIYKIVNRKQLLKGLKDTGFSIDEEISSKRKYNLPKYITWDIRNTVLNNTVWFNVVLKKNGKNTSTKTKTVKAGMEAVAQNRLSEGIWTKTQADEYMATYNSDFELGWTVELAKQTAKLGPREHKNNVNTKNITSEVNTNANVNRKRKYDLPKWVSFDRAESRNREKVSFQVSIKDKNGKRQKTYKYSVKDAVLWIFYKMVNETKQWTLEEGRDYLNTYKPEMDMVKYEISQDPKSPSVIAYNKQRNIKKLNEMMKSNQYTLTEINEFARVNGIAINFN